VQYTDSIPTHPDFRYFTPPERRRRMGMVTYA
jgi:hypothetical protein